VRFVFALVAMLFAGTAFGQTTLMQVVSLDCQFCAKFHSEGPMDRLVKHASNLDVSLRVAAFGPLVQSGGDPAPKPPVALFYAAAKMSPEASPTIAEQFYRFYEQERRTGLFPPKPQVVDQISVAAGLSPEQLESYFQSNLKNHFRSWQKTAVILSKALAMSGSSEVTTPAFVLIKDGQVAGYTHWQGDSSSTFSAVKKLITGADNER